jgi:putative endonuclease
MSKRDHHYYVYIVASRTRVLYCGVTNSVARRADEHRVGDIPGFTASYQCHRLVWFEHYQYVHNAIDREKQIKRWGRAKKIQLIERTNPAWADLSEAWRVETADLSTPQPRIPVVVGGVGEPHAAFLGESRTRSPVQCCITGIPGSLRSR